ncbi:T9SS type A sorting domain-containing protein [Flavobacterium sp.]|uniref:T9SS type A sorting domain-containing protein n=1 Tax=Flavobacterium sp. TaxID=239 RepID=UPI00391B07A3
MRTRLLLLFALLVFQISFSYHKVDIEPVVPNLPNLSVCDDNNDGFAVFDLTVQSTLILSAQSGVSSDYQITYHENSTDAQVGSTGIGSPTAYYNILSTAQTIYVRIRDVNTNELSFGQFQILVNQKPYATGPQSLMTCDVDGNPYNGIMSVNLSTYTSSILNGQNPNLYNVRYFTTQANADAGVGSIIPVSNYSATNGQIIWARVENNSTGCYALTTINILVEAIPNTIITTVNNVNNICVDFPTGIVVSPLALDSGVVNSSSYSFQWYENGVLIGGANNNTYFVNTPDLTGATRDYSVTVTSNSLLGCTATAAPFSVIQSGQAAIVQAVPAGYNVINLSGVQSIIVSVSGYGTYEYSLDIGPRQASNVFENVSLGEHAINVWDTEGGLDYSCDPLIINNIAIVTSQVPAPSGLNEQSFGIGATLANISVTGSNIQWYALPYGNTSPLPLNTTLVNGTTYYATQNVGGVESAARLAVTVQVTLGMQENEALTLQYAPNPVRNTLNIQSNSVLKSVLVYNLLGQRVFEQSYDNTNVIIDLLDLNIGNYILKVESENGQKTLRIVKE